MGRGLVLHLGKYLLVRACRRLPNGTREESYLEWTGELPAFLDDTERHILRRVICMLVFAVDQNRSARYLASAADGVRRRTARGNNFDSIVSDRVRLAKGVIVLGISFALAGATISSRIDDSMRAASTIFAFLTATSSIVCLVIGGVIYVRSGSGSGAHE